MKTARFIGRLFGSLASFTISDNLTVFHITREQRGLFTLLCLAVSYERVRLFSG